MKQQLGLLFFTAAMLAPQAVFSADAPEKSEEAKAEEQRNFGPATFDILLAGGISAEAYLHAEPSIDIGIVPIGKTMALGLGGGIDLGWCALCGLITAFSDFDWSGSYYAPFGRATLHLGTIGGLIPPANDSYTFDPYLGLLAGPSFYTFSISQPGGPAFEANRFAFRVAPLLGLRLGAAKNRFILFGEYRFGLEAGLTSVTYTASDGTETIFPQSDLNRSGNDFVVGIGIRI